MAKHFKPERDDVLPAGRPPDKYRTFLTQVGGTNPYGEARYRLVLAQYVRVWRGGVWHDWPEYTSAQEQGGLTFSAERKKVKTVVPDALGGKHAIVAEVPTEISISRQQPLRIVREMRWVERYPLIQGWILQHWDPPHLYGSRPAWENLLVPGQGPELQWLGPFPEFGAYELSCEWYDPTTKKFKRLPGLPNLPPFGLLERSIQQREKSLHENLLSANPEWRRLSRMMEWQEQQEAEKKKRIEMAQKMFRDEVKTIFASSLEAGRIREKLSRRALERRGVKLGHVGN